MAKAKQAVVLKVMTLTATIRELKSAVDAFTRWARELDLLIPPSSKPHQPAAHR